MKSVICYCTHKSPLFLFFSMMIPSRRQIWDVMGAEKITDFTYITALGRPDSDAAVVLL